MWKRNKNKEDRVISLILGRKIGSNEVTGEIPVIMKKGPKLEYVKLLDGKEEVKSPKSFLQMIVSGESLEPFGIKNGDLILAEKVKNPEEVTFPEICIFKKKAGFFSRPKYTVAKVWRKGEDVEEVLRDPLFKEAFPDLDSIIYSFHDKPEDPVVITWFEDERWFFKYKSLKDIVGIVKYAYMI